MALAAVGDALVDRFAVAPAKIPVVVPPDRRKRTIAAAQLVQSVNYSRGYANPPATEACEHGLRRRRSFAEVGDSPGFEIITKAGLLPFPEQS